MLDCFISEMQAAPSDLKRFVEAYVECALWSSTDEDGDPLDGSFDAGDLSNEAAAQAIEDCKAFLDAHADDIGDRIERAGHDFWLTRNQHGAGFWDGDWPDDIGKRLTDAAHAYGSVDLYVGDDGRLHGF